MRAEKEIDVAGHPDKLVVVGYDSRCGTLKHGVAFEFVSRTTGIGSGCWVVKLSDLAEIVAKAISEQGR